MPEINIQYTGEGADKSALVEIDDEAVGLNQYNMLNDLVTREINNGIKVFIFDLSKLNSISSSGLGILISCLKKVKDSSCTLKIVNVNEKILNIFKITKLDNVFELNTIS